MCRIVGLVSHGRNLDSEMEKAIIKMSGALSHGGPDDAGI